MLVPKPHRFLIGGWSLDTLASSAPTTTTSHPNPWDYLARVPMLLYGPGFVSSAEDRSPVDIASLAPTYAQLLDVDLDGDAEALDHVKARRRTPRAIVTIVIDGGGWNVLQQHPTAWPELASLMRSGANFVNATIGSAPSITGGLHATIGTGVYPRTHGLPGNQMRGPDGKNTDTWADDADPRFLRSETLSDVWDRQTGNRAVVACVAFEDWHLGMLGHGRDDVGEDRDVAVLWETETGRWWTNEQFYELPSYANDHSGDVLAEYEDELDPRDGVTDGAWFGHAIEAIAEDQVGQYFMRTSTPAFVELTGDVVADTLVNENVGTDEVSDLIWVELKTPDYAGHAFNMVAPEVGDVLRETDTQIGRIKRLLDERVGRGNYVLAVTADHGQEPLPDAVGGWRVNNDELERDLGARFGSVIEKVTPVDVYIDLEELARRDFELEDIARYVGAYTIQDNIPEGDPNADFVPEARLDERLFAGAFPTGYINSLTPEDLERFGASAFPQGDLR